jgi:hypothetical protein
MIWSRIQNKVISRPDPDQIQIDKLDPDPHQFADNKPKYMKYEPI